MPASEDLPYISDRDVESVLTIDELMPVMREALIEFSAGRVQQPVRSVLTTDRPIGWFGLMPAVYKDVLGAKLVTVFPENVKLGVHTHQAVIQVFRATTGEPLATIDGRVITAWRTAAVSALATQELARPDGRTLAILGSGVQARTHFHALRRVRGFEEVRIWSRNSQHAAACADELGGKAVSSAEQAVRDADVIVTATGSRDPILRGAWLKDDAHVNAIGSVGLQRELDVEAMKRAVAVLVESRESAMRESAEIVQSGAAIYAELGEIFAGSKPKPGRGITVYKSLGVAVEDIAAARFVYMKLDRS
ncbi:MAG: ornithine cyclodeaminase family protein [Acidobacteriaceae bacterium]|nr:ornithine cyclodeaminase family protein [Acidobacteriaceae bacterium]